MTPAAERLDRLCKETIARFGGRKPKEDRMARGVVRLQNLVEGLTKQIDDAADAAASEIQAKHDRCMDVVVKVKGQVGKVFDDAAQSAEDMLAQLTNGDPTGEDSSGSTKSSTAPKV